MGLPLAALIACARFRTSKPRTKAKLCHTQSARLQKLWAVYNSTHLVRARERQPQRRCSRETQK